MARGDNEMSLDFSLQSPSEIPCPHCGGVVQIEASSDEIFWQNITHNLGHMAKEAGVYEVLWRPGDKYELYKVARRIIPVLENGLTDLIHRPDYFKQFEPDNGWGDYDGLVDFVKNALAACHDNPDAWVHRSV